MDTERLSKWADLLLDTGKRNNLINFKDSKQGTVEIVAPDYRKVHIALAKTIPKGCSFHYGSKDTMAQLIKKYGDKILNVASNDTEKKNESRR